MKRSAAETKSILRQRAAEALASLTPAIRAAASADAVRLLRGQAVWQEAERVLLYAPMPGEVDVFPLVIEALAEGKTVCLPRYVKARREYEVRRIGSLPDDLAPGWFGIREPRVNCPVFELKRLDLAIVPGVVFSVEGGRIGRGKGYYDRLLAKVDGRKIGVGFDQQLVPSVPREPHDVVLDCILTPTRWIEVSPRAVLK